MDSMKEHPMKMARFTRTTLLFLLITSLGSTASAAITRLQKVDRDVYRGSQPITPGDYAQLKKLGIRTIISLRGGGFFTNPYDSLSRAVSREHENAVRENFTFINHPIGGVMWGLPNAKEIRATLADLDNPALKPIYFHCYHGRDRTGLIAALYRVHKQRVSAVRAFREWIGLGYDPKDSRFKGLSEYFQQDIKSIR